MKRIPAKLGRISLLLIILSLVLTLSASCGPPPTKEGISDARVEKVDAVETTVGTEEFPLPNCGGTRELEISMSSQAEIQKSVIIGAKATTSGGGEIGIPEFVKLKLETEVELAYQDTYNSARIRLDKITMKAEKGTHVIYVAEWEEQRFESTVSYAMGGEVYRAPYTYALRVPKLVDSREVSCTPTPSLTLTPPTSEPTATPTATPSPDGWSVVYDFSAPSLDPTFWDLDSPGLAFAEISPDGRLHIVAENNSDQWQEWGINFRIAKPFVKAEAKIELVRAEGGPAGFGISGFTADEAHCFHFNPWSNDRDDDPPLGLGYSWVGKAPPDNLGACWRWETATIHDRVPWTEANVHSTHMLQVHFTGNEIEFINDGNVVDTAALDGANNLGGSLMIRIRLDSGASVEGYLDNFRVLYLQ